MYILGISAFYHDSAAALVVDGEIKIRPIMYLALSYDHRIIDGGTSVRFLKMIKDVTILVSQDI